MRNITTLDHTLVLQMALVGYEMEASRIAANMAAIRAELGQGDARRSTVAATVSAEPKKTGRRFFSAAAKKNMRMAQIARWKAIKAAKAEAAKPKRKVAAKKPAQVKVAKKVAPKPTAKKAAPKVRKAAHKKPAVSKPVPAVQVAEPTPAEATA